MLLTETLKQTEKMSKQEFQTLFFHVLQIASEKYNISLFPNNFIKQAYKYDFEKQVKKKPRKSGFLKGKFYMADDFDEPLDDLNDYMY